MEHLTLSAGRVGVRAASAADEPLVHAWFHDPQVYAHWGGAPPPADEIRAHCTVRNEPGETVWPFIILEDDVPAGYLQAWRKFGGEAGFDLVLVPPARGRGIGPAALRLMAEHVTGTLRWPAVTVDPDPTNAHAIHAFGKAGFVAAGSPRDDETHLIMTFDPTSA